MASDHKGRRHALVHGLDQRAQARSDPHGPQERKDPAVADAGKRRLEIEEERGRLAIGPQAHNHHRAVEADGVLVNEPPGGITSLRGRHRPRRHRGQGPTRDERRQLGADAHQRDGPDRRRAAPDRRRRRRRNLIGNRGRGGMRDCAREGPPHEALAASSSTVVWKISGATFRKEYGRPSDPGLESWTPLVAVRVRERGHSHPCSMSAEEHIRRLRIKGPLAEDLAPVPLQLDARLLKVSERLAGDGVPRLCEDSAPPHANGPVVAANAVLARLADLRRQPG